MMKQWTLSALLAGSLAVACGGAPQETPAADESQPEAAQPDSQTEQAAEAPAPQPAPAPAPAPAPPPAAAAPRPPAPAPPAVRTMSVPAGTTLPLELLTPVSTRTAKVETPVRARLREAVSADGVAVLPAGTVLVGSVTEADRAGRVRGRARLAIEFHTVERNGASDRIAVTPVIFEADGTVGEDAAKVGVGATAGAIIGGILGGGSGAAQGAAIGGAAGTGVVLATRGEEVDLAEGAAFDTTLAQPFETRVPAR